MTEASRTSADAITEQSDSRQVNAAGGEPSPGPEAKPAHEIANNAEVRNEERSGPDATETDTGDGADMTSGIDPHETNHTSGGQDNEQATDSTASNNTDSRAKELDKLQRAIPVTSHRDLPTLLALQKRLEALTNSAPTVVDDDLTPLQQELAERIKQHHAWQKSIIGDVEASVAILAEHVQEGRLREAQSLWDKNQNILKRIQEPDQQRLQDLLAPHKAELNTLLDWKRFAATEKKRELIERMKAVPEDMPPANKARLIRELQDEWKLLGHSDDNDALWQEFSALAKTAFEPCKAYFRERKELQANNLIARNTLCEQLEAFMASPEHATTPLAELSRLEQQARDDWKKFAPVAQNKIKALQQRFNTVLGQLRNIRKQALQQHNQEKLALIAEAKTLITSDDINAAVNRAKELQQQWKALGPGSFKEDRKFWTDFRAACDEIFARRDNEKKAQRDQNRQVAGAARGALRDIEKLLTLDDEAFADSRSQFNQLSRAFRDALTPDLKHERKTLQDQFNRLRKRYEARLKTTPDRKTLQLLQTLQERCQLLENAELALLSGDTATASADALQQTWESHAAMADADLEKRLQKRFQQLMSLVKESDAGQQKSAQAAADKQSTLAREACVNAEIICGVDTPAADKAIRMQLQLNQLQKGLGRLPTTGQERAEKLQAIELQLLCSGPLSAHDRSTFMQRLQNIRQRL